jgi:hypothetical protein
MELDVRIPTNEFIETLRGWLAELEHLEATGAATPDSCEVLVHLHELLDKLYTMILERSLKTLQ